MFAESSSSSASAAKGADLVGIMTTIVTNAPAAFAGAGANDTNGDVIEVVEAVTSGIALACRTNLSIDVVSGGLPQT